MTITVGGKSGRGRNTREKSDSSAREDESIYGKIRQDCVRFMKPEIFSIMPVAVFHPVRILILTAGAFIFTFLCSCRTPHNDAEWTNRMDAVMLGKTGTDKEFWNNHFISAEGRSERAATYAGRRTAMLLHNIEVTEKSSADGKAKRYAFRSTAEDYGGGSAVVITADGYILTAAHCVDKLSLTFWVHDRDGKRIVCRSFRVIWKGDFENGGPDLALLKIPPRNLLSFPSSRSETIRRKSKILSSGFGTLFYNRQETGLRSIGKIQRVNNWKTGAGGARWREIFHSARMVSGDSGGPVMDENGKLAGINYETQAILIPLFFRDFVFSYAAIAVQPDPNWIHSLIEKDRARHRR